MNTLLEPPSRGYLPVATLRLIAVIEPVSRFPSLISPDVPLSISPNTMPLNRMPSSREMFACAWQTFGLNPRESE
ncbi:hypothetical protein SAMN04490203_2420 [Pseudomonas taetrolens]|uniref:Uncharacterized protein n=1 Tax=Pseudomonas taetrolens TaxID=47884 RepID=A0A1H4SIY0_PSETA|nr:hypothetical protein SAMN04490203_2420 [Pseudomonas taetrolens]SQF86572.1 Uncharacterised protein [Pseudomonas taetrolens]VEH49649.1 Uncharacterised protein [Pseudomonas taetrolens]